MKKRWSLLAPAAGVAVVCLTVATAAAATTHPATGHPAASAKPASTTRHVMPNKVNDLDCNGWNTGKYSPLDPGHRDICADPISRYGGQTWRFMDNGHYVGHDEPSVTFISDAPNSANTMTYYVKVPVDPAKSLTTSASVTSYAELSPAPWFGLPICDPDSFPQKGCTPDSDSNQSGGNIQNDAGSAFMELQFYPPGIEPFYDAPSCDATKWCAAMTIDSLEQDQWGHINPNCPEPTNFAFIQRNGVPAGPPSPQLADADTQTPNSQTLFFGQGDDLRVSITDPAAGITATIHDLTTGQTGYMVASSANGFMNTNMADCSGNPFTFHAEFNTAQASHNVPWAALEGGVQIENEIGHSEICDSLSNQDPTASAAGDFVDNNTYDTCVGGPEGAGAQGENPGDFTTATMEGVNGPTACTDSDFNCEFGDGYCVPSGSRTVQVDGKNVTYTSRVNFCSANRFQNGDVDYDGTDYLYKAWPDGTSSHPTPFEIIGPYDSSGKPYPQVQFETDGPGSAQLCEPATGSNCVVPMLGAEFYPYWTLNSSGGYGGLTAKGTACVWALGHNIPGTVNSLGGDKQYGTSDVARYGGTVISPVEPNPQFSGRCA